MSQKEIKTFDVTCDYCNRTTMIHTDRFTEIAGHNVKFNCTYYLRELGWSQETYISRYAGIEIKEYKDMCPACQIKKF